MLGPYYITTDSRRRAAWGAPCGSEATAGRVTLGVGEPFEEIFALHVRAVPAFEAWETVRAYYNYHLTGRDTGFYNCRHIQHNPDLPMSYHSWGMALDVNWLENPAGNKLVTDIPEPMIYDLLSIRTESGARVFRWGGDWDWDGTWTDHSYVDAMHWEIVAHPLDLFTGIDQTTVKGANVADHQHVPMPDDLPRAWADDSWDKWVEDSGTKRETRGHTFYREDLSWVYERVVLPLMLRIDSLEEAVDALQASNSQGITAARARNIARSEIGKAKVSPG